MPNPIELIVLVIHRWTLSWLLRRFPMTRMQQDDPAVERFADATFGTVVSELHAWIATMGVQNYIELPLPHPSGDVVLTVQRRGHYSPHELRMVAERQLARALALLMHIGSRSEEKVAMLGLLQDLEQVETDNIHLRGMLGMQPLPLDAATLNDAGRAVDEWPTLLVDMDIEISGQDEGDEDDDDLRSSHRLF